MYNKATKVFIGIIVLALIAGAAYLLVKNSRQSQQVQYAQMKQALSVFSDGYESEELTKLESKKVRKEYFFRMLRDPATNSIPDHIRAKALKYSKTLPTARQIQQRRKAKDPSAAIQTLSWQYAGPFDVGGRTRALDIDQRNSDIIIAGGVSGGIWKSTDGGNTWDLKTPNLNNFSVTYLTQDPTEPDHWYYSSGEFTGNSASAFYASSPYFGTGIFKSTDNGETWDRIPSTRDTDTAFNSRFDFISRIEISPTTGTIFISSNGFGVYRSVDGRNFSTDPIIGIRANQRWATVDVATDGTLAAVISSASFDVGGLANNPGVFISTDDGVSWTEITPDTFPTQYTRSVTAFAPSDPNILYIFTQKGELRDQGLSLHKIDLSGGLSGESVDLSSNLPDYGPPVGSLDTQFNYNMALAVKPDDPEFVLIGGTNLFRTKDGFSTSMSDNKALHWIGGYARANNVSNYPDQHADQHIIAFDPAEPDRMYVGHDGGISVTNNVDAVPVSWVNKDDGYLVTQFYDVSIPDDSDDTRLMGGTQDNGSPFFRFSGPATNPPPSFDISSGDGGYSFFGETLVYVSNQNGIVRRWATAPNGNIDDPFALVHPRDAVDQLFIHPYVVDPNDETTMFYPGGNILYRNTEIDEITNQSFDGATRGWEVLTEASLSQNYLISALSMSTLPANILYYSGFSASQTPVIMRLDNAKTSSTPIDISIPGAPDGAYVHDIAVNPANGNELLVIMSNYEIAGLYHSTDGGSSWQAVEGNLKGSNLGDFQHGPSLRGATIIPAENGSIYILATSTGIYAAAELGGENTQWGREAVNTIGFSVTEDIVSRFSNGDIAVGTHGRGIFLADFEGTISIPDFPRINLNKMEGRVTDLVIITAVNFQFSTTASENEVFFDDTRAEVVEASPSELTVRVPRDVLEPDAEDNEVIVTVEISGAQPNGKTFTILPPNDSQLGQNFPNPFQASTKIPFSLSQDSRVTLVIYDITGRRIDQPVKDKEFGAGAYSIPINFNDQASGIYIYHLIAESSGAGNTFVDTKKFTIIK